MRAREPEPPPGLAEFEQHVKGSSHPYATERMTLDTVRGLSRR
jgi:hypothetical protein